MSSKLITPSRSPGGRTSPAPLLALLLLCTPSMIAGDVREVVARWEDLPPLVLLAGREVETVLTNGVYVRGRVQKVLPDALEMRVKKTSDAAAIPKGITRIPREQVRVLTVRWKQGKGRALLVTVMLLSGGPLLAALNAQADEISVGGSLALLGTLAAAGYLVGDRIDANHMRVVLAPRPPATNVRPTEAK